MKLGRNAPCPCGSGQKYKRCCMAKDENSASSGDPILSRFFGYDESAEASPGLLDEGLRGLVCMAFEVTQDDLPDIHRHSAGRFKVGDWAVSTGAHEDTVVHGPFESMDAAFEFGRLEAGAVRFMSAVEFG